MLKPCCLGQHSTPQTQEVLVWRLLDTNLTNTEQEQELDFQLSVILREAAVP